MYTCAYSFDDQIQYVVFFSESTGIVSLLSFFSTQNQILSHIAVFFPFFLLLRAKVLIFQIVVITFSCEWFDLKPDPTSSLLACKDPLCSALLLPLAFLLLRAELLTFQLVVSIFSYEFMIEILTSSLRLVLQRIFLSEHCCSSSSFLPLRAKLHPFRQLYCFPSEDVLQWF